MRHLLLLLLFVAGLAGKSVACHSVPLVNFNVTITSTTITITGDAQGQTNGCGVYWIAAKMLCSNQTAVDNNITGNYFMGSTVPKPGTTNLPLPALTINLNDPMFCPGMTYTLVVGQGVSSGPTSPSPGATPTGTISMNWSNNWGSTGGTAQTWSVTIPGTLPPFVIDSISASVDSICPGQTSNLFVGGSGTCSVPSEIDYSWTPTIGLSDPGIQNPIASPTVTTTYIGTVYDPCTQQYASDTVTVHVKPALPVGSILNSSGDSSMVICSGDVVSLTLPGAPPGSTFQWSASTNGTTFTPITGATGSSYTPGTVSVTTIYTVQVTGNTSFCPTNSPPFTASVVPSPIINLANSVTICEGQTATVTATGGGTYEWAPPTFLGPNVNASVVDLDPPVTTTYYLNVENQFGCESQDSITVIVNPNPDALTTQFPSICPLNNGAIRVDTVNPGTAPFTYSMDGITFSADNYFEDLATGNYTVYVKDANGCQATLTNVNVPEIMDISAGFDVNALQGLVPFEAVFTNTSTGTISSYQWDFGDGATSSDQNPAHTYENHGAYYVLLYAYGSDPRCFDTTGIWIEAIGQSQLIPANVFSPNGDGVNDIFTLNPVNVLEFSMVIYDQWGKKVADITDPNVGWNGSRKSGGDASAGTYYFVYKGIGTDGINYEGSGHITLVR